MPVASGDVWPSRVRSRESATLSRYALSVPVRPQNSFRTVSLFASPGRSAQVSTGTRRGRAPPTRVAELLALVELPASYASRYPRELSGGERQRVNLARALAAEPKLIVCDEITSALDTVVAQAILDLLRDLQEPLDVGYLFISHDISTVARVADTIAVMQNGEIVGHGSTGTVLAPPDHPYTDLRLRSVPDLRTDWLDTRAGGGTQARGS